MVLFSARRGIGRDRNAEVGMGNAQNVCYALRVSSCGVRVSSCGVRVSGCALRVTRFRLRSTDCGFRNTAYAMVQFRIASNLGPQSYDIRIKTLNPEPAEAGKPLNPEP